MPNLRNWDDNNRDEQISTLIQETTSFEESQDEDVLKNLYRTEIQAMLDRWRVLKQKCNAFNFNWEFNPIPFLKEKNRFWDNLFLDKEDTE